jgi:hypothetical protein
MAGGFRPTNGGRFEIRFQASLAPAMRRERVLDQSLQSKAIFLRIDDFELFGGHGSDRTIGSRSVPSRMLAKGS